MRKLKIAFFLILACNYAQAVPKTDSSAYQTQRHKINRLLDQRSSRFGLYDNSLLKRTGIFGLKTKKDMQKSIDILTEIVKTDNSIFKELKILLEYKDFEKSTVEGKATENEVKIYNYMQAITKLQKQNELIKVKTAEIEKASVAKNYQIFFLALISIILLILVFRLNRKNYR